MALSLAAKRRQWSRHILKWWCPGNWWIKKEKKVKVFGCTQYCAEPWNESQDFHIPEFVMVRVYLVFLCFSCLERALMCIRWIVQVITWLRSDSWEQFLLQYYWSSCCHQMMCLSFRKLFRSKWMIKDVIFFKCVTGKFFFFGFFFTNVKQATTFYTTTFK